MNTQTFPKGQRERVDTADAGSTFLSGVEGGCSSSPLLREYSLPHAAQPEQQSVWRRIHYAYLMDPLQQEEIESAAGHDVGHRDGRVQHDHAGASVHSLVVGYIQAQPRKNRPRD